MRPVYLRDRSLPDELYVERRVLALLTLRRRWSLRCAHLRRFAGRPRNVHRRRARGVKKDTSIRHGAYGTGGGARVVA